MGGLLTGQLAYVFLVAILDAAVISWIALRWYRRSVLRLMRERVAPAVATAAVEPVPDTSQRSAPAVSPTPLTVALFDAQGRPRSDQTSPTREHGPAKAVDCLRHRRRAALSRNHVFFFSSASTPGHQLPRGSRNGGCLPGRSCRRWRSCSS